MRKAGGMTQKQFAEAAEESLNFIGYIERGARQPSLDTVDDCRDREIPPTGPELDRLDCQHDKHTSRLYLCPCFFI